MTDHLDEMKGLMKAAVEAETQLALAVGRFSIEFAGMEDTLNCLIHELLRLERDTGYALTSSIRNTSTRIEILRSLVEDTKMALAKKAAILTLADVAAELNSYRNILLHNPWAGAQRSSADPVWRHRKHRVHRSKNKRQWRTDFFTAEEIDKQSNRCSELETSLRPYVVRLMTRRAARKKKREKIG